VYASILRVTFTTSYEYSSIEMSKQESNEVTVEVVAAGDGKNYPKRGNTVTIHYTGYLLGGDNNVQFDTSSGRKPFSFKLFGEQVIQGLDDGVSQLSLHEKARITIPAKNAYGKRGFPGLVPRNTDIAFDVELLEFSD